MNGQWLVHQQKRLGVRANVRRTFGVSHTTPYPLPGPLVVV